MFVNKVKWTFLLSLLYWDRKLRDSVTWLVGEGILDCSLASDAERHGR